MVELVVRWSVLRALKRLGLLTEGERGREAVAGHLDANAPPTADLAKRFAAL